MFKIRRIKCGTGAIKQLVEAKDAFHHGEIPKDNVAIDEIEMTVYNEWETVGSMMNGRGEFLDIITPRIKIDGEEEDTHLLSQDEIEGFIPEKGYEYKLKVRRFMLKSDPFHCMYELFKVISKNKTASVKIPLKGGYFDL